MPVALTAAQANSRTDTTTGLATGQLIAGAIEIEVRGMFMGASATYTGLPTSNAGRATVLEGDWALLTADVIGTGTAAAPQYPRGGYVRGATAYAFSWPLDAVASVTGDYVGSAVSFATLPTTNVSKTAANGFGD